MSAHKKFSVSRSNSARMVSVRFVMSVWDMGTSLRTKGGSNITSAEAREFAADLIAQADAADAKADKVAASEARRKAWRDREIAAGRMKIFTAKEFFR